MASDLLAMRDRILDELENEDLTTGQINKAIRTAIRTYERRPMWFNTKVASFSTVADQELYTSTDPADFENIIHIDSAVCITSPGIKSRMRSADNNSIEHWQSGTVTAQPEFITRYANKIRLYPIPNSVYTITMSYVYKLDELTEDEDTNAWVDECEEVIRQGAKRRIALDILQAEDIATRCASLESDAWSALLAENMRRTPKPEPSMGWPFGKPTFNIMTGNF